MLTPVLLSGGVGSRLWPVSRETHPKQFLPLASELSMLQETLRRTSGLEEGPPLVVCNEEHRFMVAEQLRQVNIKAGALILEPQGRNTAPAVALAAIQALRADPEALLLVLPADHLMQDVGAFARAVGQAVPLAAQGRMMTFGVVPSQPGDRLRLHQMRRRSRCRTLRPRAFRGEAGRRDSPGLSGQWQLSVEQRHVPVARGHLPRATG